MRLKETLKKQGTVTMISPENLNLQSLPRIPRQKKFARPVRVLGVFRRGKSPRNSLNLKVEV